MNPITAAIWWATLLSTILLVVPNVVSWLERVLAAARHIEGYTEEILASGVGIAENTAKASALKDTLSIAPQLVSGAESIGGHVATLESALAGRGRSGNRGKEG